MSYLNLTRHDEGEIVPQVGLAGYFTVRRYHAESNELVQELKFKNLITDLGLNRLGSIRNGSGLINYCILGTGTVPPAASDTQMSVLKQAGRHHTIGKRSASANVGPDGYYRLITTYEWTPGQVTGNITEIGIGWADGLGSNYLWSRQLVQDINGAPVTLTVLPNEYLTITYEVRVYPNKNVQNGTLSFSGGGTYDYAMRAAWLQSGWGSSLDSWSGSGVSGIACSISTFGGTATAGATGVFVNDFTLEFPVAASPGVSSLSTDNLGLDGTFGSYLAGSFTNTVTGAALSTAKANFASGIIACTVSTARNSVDSSLSAVWTQHCAIFTPPIPKTASNTLSINTSISWAERVLP